MGTAGLPSEMVVDFVFNDLTLTRLTGTTFSFFLMRLGGLYDPDPSFGTGAISTFTEYAGLYNYYQVMTAKIEWDVINLDTVPKTAFYYVTHAAKYPASVSDAVDFAELSNAMRPQSMGPAAGGVPKVTSSTVVNLSNVFGDKLTYRSNSNFYSVMNTVPSSNMVAVFVTYAPSTQTLGVYSSLRITYRARLWERANALS